MKANDHLIRDLVEIHGRTRVALMPILQGVVEERNYISDTDMTEIAKELDLSAAQVFGTTTFYSFLSLLNPWESTSSGYVKRSPVRCKGKKRSFERSKIF